MKNNNTPSTPSMLVDNSNPIGTCNLLIHDSAKYSDVCEQVLHWDRAQKWTNLVQTDDVNAAPTEIDCKEGRGNYKGKQGKAGKRQTTEETVMARASTMKRARPSANRRPKMPASLRRVSRATKAVSLMIDPTARVKVTSQIVVALNVLCPRNVHEHEPTTTQCFS